jgi:hypothetical protein
MVLDRNAISVFADQNCQRAYGLVSVLGLATARMEKRLRLGHHRKRGTTWNILKRLRHLGGESQNGSADVLAAQPIAIVVPHGVIELLRDEAITTSVDDKHESEGTVDPDIGDDRLSFYE